MLALLSRRTKKLMTVLTKALANATKENGEKDDETKRKKKAEIKKMRTKKMTI